MTLKVDACDLKVGDRFRYRGIVRQVHHLEEVETMSGLQMMIETQGYDVVLVPTFAQFERA